jgi:protein-disulfide isomerase
LVEFADFECPYCGAQEPILRSALQTFGSNLRLVFKNFPITSIHPNAQGAAVAAECANAQGQFWPMHDLLYANQTALTGTDLQSYAQQVAGLNVTAWQSCLTSQPPLDAINQDVSLGTSLGLMGTPTLVINGEAFVGETPQAALNSAIQSALDSAKASGVPAANYYNQVVLGP